jgi:hypothetical protein
MISGRGIAPTRRRETTDGASATSTSRPQLGFAWSLPRHQAKDTRTLQVRIKLRNTQHEQMSSALPPRTDIDLAGRFGSIIIARIECYGILN